MEKAIKIAIENGYRDNLLIQSLGVEKPTFRGMEDWEENKEYFVKLYAESEQKRNRLVLDSAFWQALGKGLGWGKKMISDRGIRHRDIPIYYWYSFIDHLAEG